jgi:hypothetical protein
MLGPAAARLLLRAAPTTTTTTAAATWAMLRCVAGTRRELRAAPSPRADAPAGQGQRAQQLYGCAEGRGGCPGVGRPVEGRGAGHGGRLLGWRAELHALRLWNGRLVPLQQETQCCADFNTANSRPPAIPAGACAPGAHPARRRRQLHLHPECGGRT